MATLSNVGAGLTLKIRHRATFGPIRLVIRNPDKTPMDLTGFTARGGIKKYPMDTALLGAFEFTYQDMPHGVLWLSLPANALAAATPGNKIDSLESRHYYDIDLLAPDERVIPIVQGEARIFRTVGAP